MSKESTSANQKPVKRAYKKKEKIVAPERKQCLGSEEKTACNKPKQDPYIRAYNSIADHRYISMVEEAFGTNNISWWMRFGTLLLQVVALVMLTILLFVSCTTS